MPTYIRYQKHIPTIHRLAKEHITSNEHNGPIVQMEESMISFSENFQTNNFNENF